MSEVPPETFLKSPYLDVHVLPDDQYIYYNTQTKERGRMEHSFVHIGSAVLAGGAIGGFRGYLQGKAVTKNQPPKLHRVMIFNQIVRMSKLGNVMGVIALMYSGIGIALSEFRGKEDHANTILASTATGYLYKCSGGLKKMLYGGATGCAIGTSIALWSSRETLWDEWSRIIRRMLVHYEVDRVKD